MIKGIGHIGIVVKDIEKSLTAISQALAVPAPAVRVVPEKKAKVALLELGGVELEFIEDDSEEGELARFVRERGDSIHHFCLLSDDIEEDLRVFQERGVEMLDQRPRIGLRGKKIAFTKPRALNGISIELSEA